MRTSANRNSTVSEVRSRGRLGTMPATSACGKLRERQRSESGRSHGGCYRATALAELAPCVVRRDDLWPYGHDDLRQHQSDGAADAIDQGRSRAHRHAGQPHRRIRVCRLQRRREPADLASRRPDESPADHRDRPADDRRRQRAHRPRERLLAALCRAPVLRDRRRRQRAGDLLDPRGLLPAGQASEGDRLHEFRLHLGKRHCAAAWGNPDRRAGSDGQSDAAAHRRRAALAARVPGDGNSGPGARNPDADDGLRAAAARPRTGRGCRSSCGADPRRARASLARAGGLRADVPRARVQFARNGNAAVGRAVLRTDLRLGSRAVRHHPGLRVPAHRTLRPGIRRLARGALGARGTGRREPARRTGGRAGTHALCDRLRADAEPVSRARLLRASTRS